jgi:hypothetical protein
MLQTPEPAGENATSGRCAKLLRPRATEPSEWRCTLFRGYFFPGSLCPLAWNAAPNGLSSPPPAGFLWQAPQALPVCAAYSGFASADRGAAIVSAPPITAATPIAPKALTIILSSPLMGTNVERLLDFDEEHLISIKTDVRVENGPDIGLYQTLTPRPLVAWGQRQPEQ